VSHLRRRASPVAALVALVATGAPVVVAPLAATPARAAEPALPTRQQVAMNAAWLAQLPPEQIPPVDQRPVICLVDTGVDITPDLPPDRPEGPVVRRLVADLLQRSGDDEDGQGGRTTAARHGTAMASFAAAIPGNDHGMAGLVPWVRILSVRVMRKDAEQIDGAMYREGLRLCQEHSERWPIKVAVLAVACECELGDAEGAALRDYVGALNETGISVFAAAGNHGGDRLAPPANVPGVIPVSAADAASRSYCAYSTWTQRSLAAPGCGLDGSVGLTSSGGSSSAAVHAASVTAALRALIRSSTRKEVEDAIEATAAGTSRAVDTAAAAQRLGMRIEAGSSASSSSAAPAGAVQDRKQTTSRLVPLRVILTFRRGRWRVRVANRPRGAVVEVWAAGRRFRARGVIVLPRRRWTRLRARLVTGQASGWTLVERP